MSTEILRPNAAGDYENIDNVVGDGVGTHWTTVDEAVADDATSYVWTASTSVLKDAYNLGATAIPSGSTINSVTVYFRGRCALAAKAGVCYPGLRLGTNETTGSRATFLGTTWTTKSEALARPGGGSWSVADLNSLQVVIGLLRVDGNMQLTQVYVSVDYTLAVAARGLMSKF